MIEPPPQSRRLWQAAQTLWRLWDQGQPPLLVEFTSTMLDLEPGDLSALVRIDQRRRWQSGERPAAESYFASFAELRTNPEAAVDIVYYEFLLREQSGELVGVDEFIERFPGLAVTLKQQISFHHAMLELPLEDPHALDEHSGNGASRDDETPVIPGYEIYGIVAVGGMSTVYDARHCLLNRRVAIKLLGDVFPSKLSRQRFAREAQSIARLRHSNIVDIFDISEVNGRPYLVLEYIDGGILWDHYRGHAVPGRDAAQFVAVVSRAIQHCHDRGIIHRDLKPSNILLQASEAVGRRAADVDSPLPLAAWTPKVTDFGLSKLLVNESDDAATRIGAIFGTPAYMPPEQASGDSPAIGPVSDVYSLGAILYELLAARPPFQGQTPIDVMQQVVRDEPLAPGRLTRGLPAAIETICLKCLQKQPANRYQSCRELALDLDRFLANVPIHARPVPWSTKA